MGERCLSDDAIAGDKAVLAEDCIDDGTLGREKDQAPKRTMVSDVYSAYQLVVKGLDIFNLYQLDSANPEVPPPEFPASNWEFQKTNVIDLLSAFPDLLKGDVVLAVGKNPTSGVGNGNCLGWAVGGLFENIDPQKKLHGDDAQVSGSDDVAMQMRRLLKAERCPSSAGAHYALYGTGWDGLSHIAFRPDNPLGLWISKPNLDMHVLLHATPGQFVHVTTGETQRVLGYFKRIDGDIPLPHFFLPSDESY